MRHLINMYTAASNYNRSIPLGGLLTTNTINSSNQTLRGQLNYNRTFKEKTELSMIAGADLNQNYSLVNNDGYYGYDENTLKSNNILDYADYKPLLFTNFDSFNTEKITYPGSTAFSDYKTRSLSWYSNAAVTYDRRYTLSGSIRADRSSEFGQESNKGGVPYFSFGTLWNINNEKFYNLNWLPSLKLRATFGYNGNVNSRVLSRPLISYGTTPQSTNGLPNGTLVQNLTNKELRPEKTGVWNLGLDFGFRGNRISGTLEYYDKKTTDLLATGSLDHTLGVASGEYNVGDMHGYGIDFTLNTLNMKSGKFRWNTTLITSYNRVRLTKLYGYSNRNAGTSVSGGALYDVGYDLNSIFGYRWGGLDPLTGDPRGIVDGKPFTVKNSADASVIYGRPNTEARYFGSAVPVTYGSLNNNFSYGGFTISVMINYKLGYYSRRPSSEIVRYNQLFPNNQYDAATLQGAEYQNRWQKSGDEQFTNVPSLTFPTDAGRDLFYRYSEINVIKADHIRLQQINAGYTFNKRGWFLKNPRIYGNLRNLGILWKANKLGIDPDTNDYPLTKTYALGFSANF